MVRLARERLNRLRSDAQWLEAEAQQRETLLNQLEQHARAPWEPLYGGRFRHLERQWEQLNQPPSVEQEQRFHQAVLNCRKTLHDHETHEQARQQSDERREEAENTREQLLEGIEETLDGLRHASAMTVQDIDSLRAQRQLLGQRWQALSDIHPPSETMRQRYTLAIHHYDPVLRGMAALVRGKRPHRNRIGQRRPRYPRHADERMPMAGCLNAARAARPCPSGPQR
ncbi:hypothetical protein [Vreelandella titanicae]|uniref:hypothetical protein n=1 Tax=Vreelandella titanicae TaxID=664683 RepID=UPI003D2BAF81